MTPLVVVLIDLLRPAGWRLAEDRLIRHADRLRRSLPAHPGARAVAFWRSLVRTWPLR